MQTGDLINSRYRITQAVRTAWLAEDTVGGRLCLIRQADDFIDPAIALWLGRIWHPGLPRLLESLETFDKGTLLVFEYREGVSLSSLAQANGGRLTADQALPAFSQLARILAFLHHQGENPILHLDIKPEHILLDDQGQVCLIDFGAAIQDRSAYRRADSATCPDREARRALTPDYAAPEQIAGQPCPGSDIFALGISLLQLLTGQTPSACRSRSLPELGAGLSAALQRLIGRCLHSDPALRYGDAEELACDLEAVLADTSSPELITGRSEVSLMLPLPVETAAAPLPAPVVCVWDGAEFGCEMAAALSEGRQVLVIDADLLNPKADLLLGLRQITRPSDNWTAGLDLALAEELRGNLDILSFNRLVQPTRVDNVNALTTGASLDHYEHFSLDSFFQVIRLSRLVNDLVIILCSRFVYDAFTCLCLQAATHVLIPVAGESGAFRERKRAIDYLVSRQQLDCSKIRFAAFPYNPMTDLSQGTLDELCGGLLAGCISDCGRRRSMKSGARPYATSIDRSNLREYRNLAHRIQLLTMKRKR
jgi:hypothetical protein